MEANTIGERIKELRKAKNLTQDDLAVLMNSSRVQINQWETGAREISASRAADFASALDTSCEFLLRGVPVEKADSYNQTGLDFHSLSAFSDLRDLPEHKKKQYLSVLNGILGSDYFWHSVMPHIVSALTIQEHAVLGGAFAGLKDFSPEFMAGKIKEGVQALTFGNTAGYTDHILINKETAVAFQLQEAVEAFRLLLKAITEKYASDQNGPLSLFTAPYRSSKAQDEMIGISDFMSFLKSMGLTLEENNT